MSHDYTYPSIYFAYGFFALMLGLAIYFFARSARDGYWGEGSEDPKLRMFEDDDPERKLP